MFKDLQKKRAEEKAHLIKLQNNRSKANANRKEYWQRRIEEECFGLK